MLADTSTHYAVLGVAQTASETEVKQAFYRLLKTHTPEQSPREYQIIREAFDVLSNPVSRKEYDSMSLFGGEIESLREAAEGILREDEPDYGEAARLLKRAVVLGPEIGVLRALLGEVLIAQHRPQDALQQFQKAVSIDPAHPAYPLGLGKAQAELGNVDGAEAAFRRAWELAPADYAAPRALADLLNGGGRVDDALEVLEKAIGADGQVDFQDFLCFYDKLQILLLSGQKAKLADELTRVVGIAARPEEKQFASFMLGRLGGQLFELKAFELADRFIQVARQLEPDNSALAEFADASKQLSVIQQQCEEVLASDEIHDLIKHTVQIHVANLVDELDDDDYKSNMDELIGVLNNVMNVDPVSTSVRRGVSRIKSRYARVFDLNPAFFQAIIELPEAELLEKPCPHCPKSIVNGKTNVGWGGCPHCGRPVYFNGKKFAKGPDGTGSQRSNVAATSQNAQTQSSSGDCFVATAVYHDGSHPDVVALRRFRDDVLAGHMLGRVLVRLYYRFGPGWALQVSGRPGLERSIRFGLTAFVRHIVGRLR